MKKVIISVVIFICCLNVSWAQQRDDGKKRDEYGNKIIRTYYTKAEGGGVKTALPIKNGQINRIEKEYYVSGQIGRASCRERV